MTSLLDTGGPGGVGDLDDEAVEALLSGSGGVATPLGSALAALRRDASADLPTPSPELADLFAEGLRVEAVAVGGPLSLGADGSVVDELTARRRRRAGGLVVAVVAAGATFTVSGVAAAHDVLPQPVQRVVTGIVNHTTPFTITPTHAAPVTPVRDSGSGPGANDVPVGETTSRSLDSGTASGHGSGTVAGDRRGPRQARAGLRDRTGPGFGGRVNLARSGDARFDDRRPSDGRPSDGRLSGGRLSGGRFGDGPLSGGRSSDVRSGGGAPRPGDRRVHSSDGGGFRGHSGAAGLQPGHGADPHSGDGQHKPGGGGSHRGGHPAE